jgi:transcriptional regulator with XRE-family HTH domain
VRNSLPFPILPGNALVGLGERVALSRKARGLTQRDLAHIAGVGVSSIVSLETGQPGVAIGTLARALDAMDLLGEMERLVVAQRDEEVTRFALSKLQGRVLR